MQRVRKTQCFKGTYKCCEFILPAEALKTTQCVNVGLEVGDSKFLEIWSSLYQGFAKFTSSLQ